MSTDTSMAKEVTHLWVMQKTKPEMAARFREVLSGVRVNLGLMTQSGVRWTLCGLGRSVEEKMFNEYQIAHMESLAKTPPEQRCYCGWYLIGEVPGCPNCPPGLTSADKIARWCPTCRSAPPATNLAAPIIHAITCRLQADKTE